MHTDIEQSKIMGQLKGHLWSRSL